MKKKIKYYVKADYDVSRKHEVELSIIPAQDYRNSESSEWFETYEKAQQYIEEFDPSRHPRYSNFQFSIHKFWEC